MEPSASSGAGSNAASADRERQLMRDLARIQVPLPALVRAVEALKQPVDWQRFTALCHRNSVSGLLYVQLRHHSDLIPPAVLEHFQRQYNCNQALHIVQSHALLDFGEQLHRHGCEFILMRGPALVEEIYLDGGLRPYCDLDLLMEGRGFESARAVLQQLGFLPRLDYPNTLERDGISVDLHRDALNRDRVPARRHFFSADPGELFGYARMISIEGQSVRVLDLETTLITLSLHLVKHGLAQQLWWIDLAEALERWSSQIRWEELQLRARRWSCLPLIGFVLRYLSEQMQCAVPEDFLGRADPRPQRYWNRRATRAVARQVSCEVAAQWLVFSSLPGLLSKWQYAHEHIFPRSNVRHQIASDAQHHSFVLARLAKLGRFARDSVRLVVGR